MARRVSYVKRFFALGLIIGCLFIFVQGRRGMPPVIERTFSSVLYPILSIQRAIGNAWHGWQERRRSHDELLKLVAALSAERADLQARLVELMGELNYENATKELRDFAYRYKALSTYGMLAQVLVRNFTDQEHFFFVDAGEKNGVRKDMIAVYQNGLVGRVVDVWPAYSKVLLVTDKMCNVAAYGASTNAHGIHEGCNQVMMSKLTKVSHLENMRVGDLVLSSGEGLVFPAGFALGLITSCMPDGLFYHVDIEPLFDLSEISYCYLFAKGDEAPPLEMDMQVTVTAGAEHTTTTKS